MKWWESLILGPIGRILCWRWLYLKALRSDKHTEPERCLVNSNRYPSTNSMKCTIAFGQIIGAG